MRYPKPLRKLLLSIKKRINPHLLFHGNDSLFKELLLTSKVYGEYGCGDSTLWVYNNTKSKIISVDTSEKWASEISSKMNDIDRYILNRIDCGEVGEWGMPIDDSKKENFIKYCENIWKQDYNPDLILIDGRFRVCCFLISLKYADENVSIIFDDYNNRPYYHIVEEFVKPIQSYDRQALFKVPSKNSIDFTYLDSLINRFIYVKE
tara:strand:+ start:66 stop:683 length:618 start_codon:yes stop_codon:yes gene_type:complete